MQGIGIDSDPRIKQFSNSPITFSKKNYFSRHYARFTLQVVKILRMKIPGSLFAVIFVAYLPFVVCSQEADSSTFFQYLQRMAVSEITLAADFQELYARRKEEFQVEAVLSWQNEQGEENTIDLQLELRGKNRRRTCDYPPIRLNFDKDRLEEHGFSRIGDKLKLVAPCNMEEESDQYVLKEYWTYRLYNQITPNSFRVQLLNIRFIDTHNSERDTLVKVGFFIESEEELAERLGGEEKDLWGAKPEQVDRPSYYHTVLFQFMIGNDDWDLSMNRNIAFIQVKSSERPLVIPYDFDFAGLVNPTYAKPNRDYGATSVTDRVPIGQFDSRESLRQVCDEWLMLRKEVIKVYKDCTFLDNASKREMTQYLNESFALLRNNKEMERFFFAE